MGYGANGRLGFGDEQCRYVPTLIEGDLTGQKVVRIAVGSCHSLVQVDGGAVYSFGDNINGQLGHGGRNGRAVPTRIEALEQHEVVEIAAGAYTSLVRAAAGDVLQFGLSVTVANFQNLLPTVIPNALD